VSAAEEQISAEEPGVSGFPEFRKETQRRPPMKGDEENDQRQQQQRRSMKKIITTLSYWICIL
jgi:hypothetical protein